MRFIAILLCLFCVSACGNDATSSPANAAVNDSSAAAAPPPDANEPLQTEPWRYPRERTVDGNRVIVYTPQIRSWQDFTHFEAIAAIEFFPKDGGAARYGTTTISGATEVDLDKRLVIVTEPKIDDVSFPGTGADAYEVAMSKIVLRERVEIPLDMFLLYLSDEVLEDPPPPGFNTKAPPIHVAETPTLLLFVNGKPVLTPLEKTGLELVVNANFPVLRDTATGTYYLITGPQRLKAPELKGPWTKAGELPAGFAQIDPKGEQAAIAAAVATPVGDAPVPKVIVSPVPAELIVTEGKPELKEIPDTGGLRYVANTDSPLFSLDGTYYYLVSGRWFETKRLEKGPWKFVPNLPDAFSKIPADHEMADVRASVPGTVEAKTAALEALLPTRKSVAVGAAPDVKVSYGGDPKFEPISGTQVSRAVNSGNDVILYDGKYYLCYEGAWYESASANGPWTAAATVPEAIYKIPPDSASYPVTQVVVQEATPTTVVYSYPPSYSTGVYVVYGVPWYGTGWYYPPYIYGPYYYPYWGSYGHGYWYSGATGAYGSRSVWYGPYGGYSYSQGYNPRTGRYGYVETAWDGDDWKSHSEKYNPRTGIASETSRHYNADGNNAHMGARDPGSERQRDRHGAQDRFRQADRDDEPQDFGRGRKHHHAHLGRARQHDVVRHHQDRRRPHRDDFRRASLRRRQHHDHRFGRRTGVDRSQRRSRRHGDARRHVQQGRPDHRHDDEAQRRHDRDQGAGQQRRTGRVDLRRRRPLVGRAIRQRRRLRRPQRQRVQEDRQRLAAIRPGWLETRSTRRIDQRPAAQRRRQRATGLRRRRLIRARRFNRDSPTGGAQDRASGGYGGGIMAAAIRGGRYDGGYDRSNEMRQLDRDARARSGGYDRFEQRRSMSSGGYNRGGMSRGGGMRGGGGGRRR